MFKRIETGSLVDTVTAVLLVVFALIFFAICIRMFTAKRKKMDRMARMPLEDEAPVEAGKQEKHHD